MVGARDRPLKLRFVAHDLHEGFRDPRSVPGDESGALPRAGPTGSRACAPSGSRCGARSRCAPACGCSTPGAASAWRRRGWRPSTPEALITGLDRNRELLRIAELRADPPLPNLSWLEGDLTKPTLPASSFDAIRSERVLMHLPDGAFERALGDLVRLLRPGGRMALFELDYGATILAPGSAVGAVPRATEVLRGSLPQPLAGRRIPGLLAEQGLRDVVASPFSFAADEPVWRRIVGDTLTAAAPPDAGISAWLDEQRAAAARGEFVAAFTGILTVASRS